MKIPRRGVLALVPLLAAAWLAASWVEAEKEVRVLCAQFVPGDSLRDVIRQLETGEYLRYVVRDEEGTQAVTFHSLYNLRTTRCAVALDGGVVRESRYGD